MIHITIIGILLNKILYFQYVMLHSHLLVEGSLIKRCPGANKAIWGGTIISDCYAT